MSHKKKKPGPINFIITTSDANEASEAANKRRVRSVAALKSWPERRRKNFQTSEPSISGNQSTFLVEETGPKSAIKAHPTRWQNEAKPSKSPSPSSPASTSASTASSARSSESPDPTSAPVQPKIERQAVKYEDTRSDTASEDASTPSASTTVTTPASSFLTFEDHSETPCRCPRCLLRRQLVRHVAREFPSDAVSIPIRHKRMADGIEKHLLFSGDLASVTPPTTPEPVAGLLNGRADPFNCYPVTYEPWFDSILHHMLNIYAPRGWPALNVTREQGNQWEWFMTQNALSEPALFYVRLLFGSGDLIRLGSLRPQISYWLRAQAIKAINEALRDPERAISDAMILAVGRIALHESLYGDRHAANTIHRPAQKRMIAMRGGLAALNFPPLVSRLMRWADGVMALQSGSERIMEEDETNPGFTLEQSVDVLERWVPKEGASLRSNIGVSEIAHVKDDG